MTKKRYIATLELEYDKHFHIDFIKFAIKLALNDSNALKDVKVVEIDNDNELIDYGEE